MNQKLEANYLQQVNEGVEGRGGMERAWNSECALS